MKNHCDLNSIDEQCRSRQQEDEESASRSSKRRDDSSSGFGYGEHDDEPPLSSDEAKSSIAGSLLMIGISIAALLVMTIIEAS